MKILNSQMDFNSFIKNIRQAQHGALLLDYDGTLAPFQIERDKAFPYPGVREILTTIIEARHTRVVIVSGRQVSDIVRLLELNPLPEIWGSHGQERLMPDETYEVAQFDEFALRGLFEADTWLGTIRLSDRCEHKPGCLALHWRGLDPEAIKAIRKNIWSDLALLAKQTGLWLNEFDGGIELCVPGRGKGFVVKTLLAEVDEKTKVAYLGDDLTDEDAFNAIKGKGLSILSRPQFRSTVADWWIKPPNEVLEFLNCWMVNLGSKT
ncbi:MAG: trehalose-phosphatase [Acidobacteriota bacterium]